MSGSGQSINLFDVGVSNMLSRTIEMSGDFLISRCRCHMVPYRLIGPSDYSPALLSRRNAMDMDLGIHINVQNKCSHDIFWLHITRDYTDKWNYALNRYLNRRLSSLKYGNGV